MKRLLSVFLITACLILAACSSSVVRAENKETGFPDVYCADGKIYLNDMVIAESDCMTVYRIDNSIVSISTGERIINVKPDGTAVTLADLIIDKEKYEEGIKSTVDFQLSMRNAVGPTTKQYEEMMAVLSSYEEAIKLDFIARENSISIISPFIPIQIFYEDSYLNPEFKPTGELMCSSHITGRCVSYFPDEINRDEYNSIWVTDSMAIHNYNGENYYMYKTTYQTETTYGAKLEDDIYYLIISKEDENNKRVVIGYKEIDGNYNCSFRDFEETLKSLK